jgi:hypothetical protein
MENILFEELDLKRKQEMRTGTSLDLKWFIFAEFFSSPLDFTSFSSFPEFIFPLLVVVVVIAS